MPIGCCWSIGSRNGKVGCWVVVEIVGQLLLKVAFGEQYEHQNSYSTCVIHQGDEKECGLHHVYFYTDLAMGAKPTQCEGAMMINSVWLCGTC